MSIFCRSPLISNGVADDLIVTTLFARRLPHVKPSRPYARILLFLGLSTFFTVGVIAQTPNKPREVFRDGNGDVITNNEFVDLRLANSADKTDPATRTALDDGTVEFRITSPRQEGTLAPTFDVPDIDAKWINTDELKGKVIVLNFWFIGCVGCMDEIPKLSAIADKFRDSGDITFVAVATNTPQELRSFTRREKFNYRHVGQGLSLVKLFGFRGYPRNIVIGRDGKIVYWRTTIHAWDKFESVIKAELEKN